MKIKILKIINYLAIVSLFLPMIVFADEATSTLSGEIIINNVDSNNFIFNNLSTSTAFVFRDIKITIASSSILGDNEIDVKIASDTDLKLPWKIEKISRIFEYDIINENIDLKIPLNIEIKTDQSSPYLKKIYYFDEATELWRPLNSKEDFKKGTVIAQSYLKKARIGVFSNPDALVSGSASWYKFKKGNFAASPDFAKGTRLRVYNLNNKKFVDVEINDYGPDRRLHPDRVIDLAREAFLKIAPLGAGVVKVFVELLENQNLGFTNNSASADLNIKARAAIVINEKTGDIIYNKNPTSTMPLASLTKIVAVKVFLDTHQGINRVVTYKKQDENYNYQYVDYKWQSARLKVADGENLTIEDLVYSALVGSANNAVETLVRVSGYSRDEFIARMNKIVSAWGASSTYFAEPTGLSPKNVSSVYDYAIITKEAYSNPFIEKVSITQSYTFYTKNTKKKHLIRNTNNLVHNNNFKITGSKTGYLEEAGYCLMTRAKTNSGKQVIAVTFGEKTKGDSDNETKELLQYGIKKIK